MCCCLFGDNEMRRSDISSSSNVDNSRQIVKNCEWWWESWATVDSTVVVGLTLPLLLNNHLQRWLYRRLLFASSLALRGRAVLLFNQFASWVLPYAVECKCKLHNWQFAILSIVMVNAYADDHHHHDRHWLWLWPGRPGDWLFLLLFWGTH